MKLLVPSWRVGACAAVGAFAVLLGILAERPGTDTRPAAPAPGEPKKSDAPGATLVIVGPKLGTMEPCGCVGGQLGGLARLKFRLELSAPESRKAVVVDCGEWVKGNSEMESIRGDVMAMLHSILPVSAVSLGPSDLASDPKNLETRVGLLKASAMAMTTRLPNALLQSVATGGGPSEVASSVVVPSEVAEGKPSRVLVLSLVDGQGIVGAEGRVTAADSARAELAKQKGKFDLCVAVFHGFAEKAQALVAAVPEIDLLVLAQGNGTPDLQPQLYGNTLLLHPGQKGRHVVELALARRGGKVVFDGYKVEPITSALPEDPEAKALIDGYRDRLKEDGIVEKLKNKLPAPGARGYAGSPKCGECHTAEYKIWQESKHSHAVESMSARKGQWDPDCLKCHALGWYSEPPMGEKTGYTGTSLKLGYVGCESCHGPSALHASQPTVNKPPSRDVTCQKCHDVENSPEFDRSKFWLKIQHKNSAK